jgi:uncharacterized protein Yka (UPF0111/DUF47 family)
VPSINFDRKNLPFVLGGKGEIAVNTGELNLKKPLDPSAAVVFKVGFQAGGDERFRFGHDDTLKFGVSVAAGASLTPVFASSAGAGPNLLKQYGVSGFFKNGRNEDRVILVFEAGASGSASAAAAFPFSSLKPTVEIAAGADGAFSYLRAVDRSLPIERLLVEFFKTMRLPEQPGPGTHPAPQPGEAIALRYGGYLRLAAEMSAGHRISGTKSVSLGSMALSEKYDLSIIGKIGLSAGVAGRFSILVTGDEELPGWARVQVRRHRSKEVKIAADVDVKFKSQLDDVPASADEFLGAALGVNAKSFINVFQRARELSDFDQIEKSIDGLAQRFLGEFTGRAFHQLANATELGTLLGRVNEVVNSYEELGDRAVTLFDRYADKLPELLGFLEKIQDLEDATRDVFRKQLNPQTWNILSQLTDGDPLGFLLRQVGVRGVKIDSLKELKGRAELVQKLVKDPAHVEIRRVVTLAKQSFGLDKMFAALAKIDTVDELAAVANEKVGQFVSRLVGRSLDSAANLKHAFQEVRAVLDKLDTFKNKLFDTFKQAANSSYKLALHAEYSRATENDALVDVLINLEHERGPALLSQAGKGDFEEILVSSDSDVVRLREGVFTHRTRRESAFNVTILGWHVDYRYEGFDRVITETEQRLVPSEHGITVLTTADLKVERKRRRQDEEVHVNFLLRALGESAKVLKAERDSTAFLIETLSSLSARYDLAFTDEDTSATELRDYLAFAEELGLDRQGATVDALMPDLPGTAHGSFGRVEAAYEVRFGAKAVAALLAVTQISKKAEAAIRASMRRMVLVNYLKDDAMHDVAFAYASPSVFQVFDKEGFAKFAAGTAERVFAVAVPGSSIAAPREVRLDRMERQVLTTLYNIENSMVSAITGLYKLLHSGKPVSPREFEKKLGSFGDALKNFDRFDQTSNRNGTGTSTIFAMFDALVRLASSDDPANVSVLRLKSEANGRVVEKLFLSDEAAEVGSGEDAPKVAAAGR